MSEQSQKFETLSNIKYLYILTIGVLPTQFGDILNHLGSVVGENFDGYQGTRVE